MPDLFNSDQRWQRPALIFLYGFRDDFVKPVPKDGREHIEYVPSQIVTEFFRYRFHDEYGRRVRGILYPSVQVDRGNACVLFVSYEDCTDDWEFGEPLKPPFNLVGHETQELASAHGT